LHKPAQKNETDIDYFEKGGYISVKQGTPHMYNPQNQTMKKSTLITICLLLAAGTAKANGDPVAVHSAITLSPTPVAVHVPEVQLIDEYVTFVPSGLYTTVMVRYLLHNRSSRSFDSLPYGFPIDYWGSGSARWTNFDDFTESEMEVGWRESYIRNVNFMLGDRQLPWQCSRDTVIIPSRKIIAYDELIDFDTAGQNIKHIEDSLFAIYGEDTYTYTKPVSRRWYYTYITIPANSFATLEVRYTVENNLSEGAYYRHNNFYEYLDNYYWDLQFQYDFTPAAYWGDGHADHFAAVLDATDINIITHNYFLRGVNRYPVGIGGLPMKKEGNTWRYEARRFDLAAAKPFVLDYRLKQPVCQPLDRLFNHRVDPSEYTITVSGTDPKYPASNLTDLDYTTATVLQPDRHDSLYITIRFNKPTNLEGIMILNGYTKNADTWRNNAHIDSAWISAVYYEIHHYSEDTTTYVKDIVFGYDNWRKNNRPSAYHVAANEPTGYSWQHLLDNATVFSINYPWSDRYFTELHLCITDIKKGLKYDDLCISELILIGR